MRQLRGVLIVSCQAGDGEPLARTEHIVALALSAIAGGAKGLRLEGADNIYAARRNAAMPQNVPIVGLIKAIDVPADERISKVYITASFKDAVSVTESGADVVALDATGRPRADGLDLKETIKRIHDQLHKPVWADVATLKEGITAAQSGADIVSTTLFGYTEETQANHDHGPDFILLKELVQHLSVPVVLEGRVWDPKEVKQAFEAGAYAVVVGSAITRPKLITERFVNAIPD